MHTDYFLFLCRFCILFPSKNRKESLASRFRDDNLIISGRLTPTFSLSKGAGCSHLKKKANLLKNSDNE